MIRNSLESVCEIKFKSNKNRFRNVFGRVNSSVQYNVLCVRVYIACTTLSSEKGFFSAASAPACCCANNNNA